MPSLSPKQLGRILSGSRLVAVFDESGTVSNVPGAGQAEDFALGAIIFSGRRAFADIESLDETLAETTGSSDYKYRQVRQSEKCRRAFIESLQRQSGFIRVFSYYAAGGAYLEQARRELGAARGFGHDPSEAEENLRNIEASPRRVSLGDAVRTSIPAMSTFAASRGKRISVFFDQRSDLADISQEVTGFIELTRRSSLWGGAYERMDWEGPCPTELEAVARVADVLAGDVRATFKRLGEAVWALVEADGFVGRHSEAAAFYENIGPGPVPMPRVGWLSNETWDDDWHSASTTTTMFGAYRHFLLNNMFSLFSPCGRGLLLRTDDDGFAVYQQMD